MNDIKYRYAHDEHRNIVPINKVNKENKSTYYCITCGERMIPRIGTKKVAHFAHKGNSQNCNGETYLHKLAKELIKKKFEQSDSFKIGYYRNAKCNRHNICPLYNPKRCYTRINNPEIFDLKEYYDTCQEEKECDGFIADLLLSHSQRRDRAPIFIEIHVNHKSTEKKKNSGHKIIELTIKSEEDIEHFVDSTIEETLFPEEKKNGCAEFYGFDRFSQKTREGYLDSFPYITIHKSGKPYVEFKCCYDAFYKSHKDATCICFIGFLDKIQILRYGYLLVRKKGNEIKTCYLCKYYKNTFCCLYKKHDTPKNPNRDTANTCKYYREDEEVKRVNATIKEKSPTSGEITGLKYYIL